METDHLSFHVTVYCFAILSLLSTFYYFYTHSLLIGVFT